MGAFYNSICIRGNQRRQVRESLERWLGGRGFELVSETLLFDLDGETERCAFVVWSERWTLLFFSKYEEERRLIRELQTWSDQLLYVWVQDSDVWGYDLLDAEGFAGSFNSDPKTYRSFADDAGARPTADLEDVCRRLGLGPRAAELKKIHRRGGAFMEDACFELCRLVGAEPALTSYDDLESGNFEAPAGWQVEQLFFVHRDAMAVARCPADLHELRLSGDLGDPASPRRSRPIEIPPEVLEEMERRSRRTRALVVLLRPLSWLARAARSLSEAPHRDRRKRERGPSPAPSARRFESSDVIEVRHLINERHRCRIRLAVGAQPKQSSQKPAAVFAFQIGDTAVTCTARRRSRIEEVLQQPSRSTVLRDDRYQIGGLKARHVVFELPPYYLAGTTGPSYLGLHVVQTEPALYVFLYRFRRRIVKEVERAIGATVRSFRLT